MKLSEVNDFMKSWTGPAMFLGQEIIKFINPSNKTVVEIDGEAIPVIYRRRCAEQNGNNDKLPGSELA